MLELVKKKDYFVITTNCDGQFRRNGFDESRVFEVQGSYAKLQCEIGCHKKLYDNKKFVYEALEKTDDDLKVPLDLVPKCPVCYGRMNVNLRCDDHFVEDEHWHSLASNYENFVQNLYGKKVLLMEFGVGFNTPGIIRFPFERMTFLNSNTKLIRFNKDYPEVPKQIEERSICVSDDIANIIKLVKKL